MRNTMARALVALVVLSVAGGGSAATPPGRREAPKASPDSKKPAKRSDAAPEAKAPPRDPADLKAAMRAKSSFMLSVELCERKDTCDAEMLRTSEQTFVTRCEKCATPQHCEAERKQIRDGQANRKLNPCR
jgi:hypothetical protein